MTHYTTIAVDPATHGYGVSCWVGNELTAALYLRHDRIREFAIQHPCDDLVIEIPQVYPGMGWAANGLCSLAFAAGEAAGVWDCSQLIKVQPPIWTLQVPKDRRIIAIQQNINSSEHGRVELPSEYLADNVWDAVGLGMWRLDRVCWARGSKNVDGKSTRTKTKRVAKRKRSAK